MILAISPHLDDAVFSCGGYLRGRARVGRPVECVTVFTRSHLHPSGFALACQLDKELTAEVDYMHLRRAEDRAACAALGIGYRHLDFSEAPHRGYGSAPELFAGVRSEDPLDLRRLDAELRSVIYALRPDEVLYPFGAGDHVDHLQVIAAVRRGAPEFPDIRFRQYYDLPYARKFVRRYPELGGTVPALTCEDDDYTAKLAACRAYTTQVGFQFGGAQRVAEGLGREEYLVG